MIKYDGTRVIWALSTVYMSTAATGHCRDSEYKQRLAAADGTQREIKSYCPDNISHEEL